MGVGFKHVNQFKVKFFMTLYNNRKIFSRHVVILYPVFQTLPKKEGKKEKKERFSILRLDLDSL